MALALYRTYRPGSLTEVIGQEHVTEPLARALEAGRTHHAYLFSGPRGCGKTSTARILARSLNCEQGPSPQPCGQCRSCEDLAPNGPGSIDVVELDAATHRGIDDARELREKAIYAPAASRFKIYIIDEAHQLTNEAANALLKLVEEPPPHLRFIFATTEPDKIIPTIRSRTFHYGFRLVPARLLAEHLASVCRAEQVPAEGPALAVVARAGAGSVRDSLSVLGQLLAGAGPEGLTYADAVSALGLTDANLMDAFVSAVAAGSAAEMFAVVDRVISAGHDPRRFVADVLDRLRDLIILRADPGALSSGLVDVPDDTGERMLAQAQSLGLAELSRAADLVSTGLGEMRGATAPRLQLELLCARLALPAGSEDLGDVLARLERVERALASATVMSVPSASAVTAGAASAPVPGSTAQPDPDPGHRPEPTGVTTGEASREAPAPPAGQSHTVAENGRPAPPRRPQLRSDATQTQQHIPARPSGAGAGAAAAGVGAAADADETAGVTDRVAPGAGGVGPEAPMPGQVGPMAPAPAAPPAPHGPAAASAAGPPPPAPAPAPGARSVVDVQAAWPAVLTRLAGDSRVAWTVFHAASPVSLSQGVLAVAVAEPGNVRAIAQRGHDERLRQALIDVLGLDVRIDVLHDPGAVRAASPQPTTAARTGGPREADGPPPAGPGPVLPGPVPAGPVVAVAPAGTVAEGDPRADQAQATAQARRGVDMVRAAAATPAQADHPDEPSEDDPDLSATDGIALVTRELGARPIGEIDHS